MSSNPALSLYLEQFQIATQTRAALIFWRDGAVVGDAGLAARLQDFRPARPFSFADLEPDGSEAELSVARLSTGGAAQAWVAPICLDSMVVGLAAATAAQRGARSVATCARLLAAGVAHRLRKVEHEGGGQRVLAWLQALAEDTKAPRSPGSQSIYASFLDGALQFAEAASGSLMLINPASNLPELVSSVALASEAWQSPAIPSVAATVVKEGRPILLGDPRRDPRFADKVSRSDVVSSISIPIMFDGAVRAVVNLNRRQAPDFGPEDLDRVNAWAAEHAIALAIAWRMHELRQQAVELAVLKTVGPHTEGSSSDDLTRLQTILGEIASSVRAPLALLQVQLEGRYYVLTSPASMAGAASGALGAAHTRCVNAGPPLVEVDLSQGRRRLPSEVMVPAGIRSCLAVAARSAESTVMLAIFDAGPRRFVEAEPAVLAIAAEYMSTALQLTRLQRDMKDQRGNLLALSARVVQAQEDERHRVALELHDDVAQALSSLYFRIQTLEHLLTGATPQVCEDLRRISLSTREVLDNVMAMMFRLRPTTLDRHGLFVSLRQLVRHFSHETGIQVTIEVNGPESRPSADVEVAVYRLVQEALTNVRKHSGAHRAGVVLHVRGVGIAGRVVDDGRGFAQPSGEVNAQEPPHLGIVGMRERAQQLGGSVEIKSAPGRGAVVEFFIPLRPSVLVHVVRR